MKVFTINLTLNLLLPHVVLTSITIRNSESTDSSIMKLLHTNTPVRDFEISTQWISNTNSLICDFEISTQKFRSAIVVDLIAVVLLYN